METDAQQEIAANGRRLYWAAIVALLLGMTALYHAVLRHDGGIRLQEGSDGTVMVILERRRDSHFGAEGEINGQKVKFMVDTGATDVAMSDEVARSLGLEFGPRIDVMTAGGPVKGWVTRLDSVTLGVLTVHNVRATITPGLGEECLLGMSFLSNFSIVQEGDTLAISTAGGVVP